MVALTLVATYVAGTPTAASAGEIRGIAGKCLDAEGANAEDGTRMQLRECNGTNAQNWHMRRRVDQAQASAASGSRLWDRHMPGTQ
jgi:hypothetical protein